MATIKQSISQAITSVAGAIPTLVPEAVQTVSYSMKATTAVAKLAYFEIDQLSIESEISHLEAQIDRKDKLAELKAKLA